MGLQQYGHVGVLADTEIEPSTEYAHRLVAEVRKQVTSPPRTAERFEGLVKGVDVDCVYHLNLSALTQASDDGYGSKVDKNAQRTVATFRRLVEQRLLRD